MKSWFVPRRKIGKGLAALTLFAALASPTLVSAAPSIDFHIWKLQQPDGSSIGPSTLSSGYSSRYFYVASDGFQAFMDTQTGTSTGGSAHPRSELRELNTDGSNAAWKMSGTNTMTVTAKVTKQGGGTSGRTTIAQVFDGSGGHTEAELEYTANPNSNGGNFQLLYYDGSISHFSTKVALNTQFTYEMSLTNGVLNVYINGSKVSTKSPPQTSDTFYFKAGDYDQTATIGSNSTTPYTIVELKSVSVVHS